MMEENAPIIFGGKESLLARLQNAESIWRAEKLPILEKSDEIKQAFHTSDRILLEAETGSGKSTASPILLLEELLSRNPDAHIVVSQPRRIATEGLADYVGSKVGKQYIGFHHRQHTYITPETRITYEIEKSLLNELLRDPMLTKYDAVMLDEIHERSIDLDILMPLLKQTQKARAASGKPLKLVLTSATVDRDKMLAYFEGTKHVQIPGRTFPVEEEFSAKAIDTRDLIGAAAERTEKIVREGQDQGDILIFMPGREEISKTIDLIKQKISDPDIDVIPLLGGDETTNAYKQSTGRRKIIVATNVAETSITIPTVRIVIDSGLLRTNVYDGETGTTELLTLEHTQSNAKQRKGRAGRTAPGKIYYLYTKEQFDAREPYLRAEILRTNLASQVLQMKAMGIQDVHNFDYLDHPGKEKIDMAIITLKLLGALDAEGNLTDGYGKPMSEIDADPHFARMIVEAKKRGCQDAVSLLVGMMSGRRSIYDPKFYPERKFTDKYGRFIIPGSDFLTQLNIWNEYVENNTNREKRMEWATQNGINTYSFYNAANERKDLLHEWRTNNDRIDLSEESRHAIAVCLTAGLMDSLLIRDSDGTYSLASGKRRGIILGKNSVLQNIKPPNVISGAIRYIEQIKKTFADFNMSSDEKLIREAAPYLPEKKKEEPSIPLSKPETFKPAEKPPEIPALPVSPTYQPVPFTPEPVYRPIPKRRISFKDVLLFIPRSIIKGIRKIASLIGRPFAWVFRNIRRLFQPGKKKK